MNKTKNRNLNLDLIRCIAVLSVLSVHFFLNNGYYDEMMVGKRMFVATIMRSTFIICVPLFMMLTGYLMNTKKISKQYFFKIMDVFGVYVLSTLLILLYKIVFLHEQYSFLTIIQNILSYKQYSWYIEMYMGLYLLIPFLNVMWQNLNNQKEKLLLIGVFFFITTAPSITLALEWAVVPDWWEKIYPITYYFVGAYLCEAKDKIKMSWKSSMCLLIITVILSGAFSYYKSYGDEFRWGPWNDYEGIMTFLTSVAAFVFLLKVKMERWPNWLKQMIKTISVLSLPIYLTSCIADSMVYTVLNNRFEKVTDRFFYYVPVVGIVFVISFVCAIFVEGGNRGMKKIVSVLKH